MTITQLRQSNVGIYSVLLVSILLLWQTNILSAWYDNQNLLSLTREILPSFTSFEDVVIDHAQYNKLVDHLFLEKHNAKSFGTVRFLGILSFWSGEYDRVIDVYKFAFKANKLDVLDRFVLGYAHWKRGQYRDAEQVWRSAPQISAYFSSLGSQAEYTKQWHSSAEYYQIATVINPNENALIEALSFAQALAYLDNKLDMLGLAKELEIVALVIDQNAYSYRRELALGEALYGQGLYDLAEYALLYAVKQSPDSMWPHFYLGMTLYKSGRIPDAILHLSRATFLSPSHARSRYWLARALVEEGKEMDALIEYQAALRLAPDDPQIKQELTDLKKRLE